MLEIDAGVSLDSEEKEFLTSCIEAHATVETTPGFSHLRDVRVNGSLRYNDIGAACSCTDLKLYVNAGYGYTVCREHGLTGIGLLRRDLPVRKAR